jgi:hypothetical protein
VGGEVLGQGPVLVAGPGPEGVDELVLVDHAILEGDDSEELVAVGGDERTSVRAMRDTQILPGIARGGARSACILPKRRRYSW